MFATSIAAEVAATRQYFVLPNGTGVWRTNYIRADHDQLPSPEAYLIEQDANQDVQSHFHEQPEFQLIVDGTGSLGRNAVTPITMHYANAYTGYGPISAGPQGISYVTLRPMRDNGAMWLPEDREKMKRAPKKFFHSAPIASLTASERMRLSAPIVATIADEGEGLGAWKIVCGPHQSVMAASPSLGGGQYLFLHQGSAQLNAKPMSAIAYAFASADEAPVNIRSGADGAELLVMQFARAEYTHTYNPSAYRYAEQEKAMRR
jgi:hypothetical protein